MKLIERLKFLIVVFIMLSCVRIFLYIKNVLFINNFDDNSIRQTAELSVRSNALRDGSPFKMEKTEATVKCLKGKDEDRMRVNMEFLNDIPKGPLKRFKILPGDIPSTIHYVWCGDKNFLFEDFLGFLSFVRIIQPVKIILHYNKLPRVNEYHTWFQIVTQSLAQLVLRKTDKRLRCNTDDSLNFGLEQLAASPGGGVYFGLRAALTYIPLNWKTDDYLWYTTSGEQVILYAKFGLAEQNQTFEDFKSRFLSKPGACVDADKFNKEMKAYDEVKNSSFPDGVVSPCVVLPKGLFPKDIINVDTPFAANFRRIFYGKSELLVAKPSQDPDDLIPLIIHYVIFTNVPNLRPEWSFREYLSVLSALYLGGFQRVYIHGDQVPTGQWWDRLQNENITFVFIEKIETVYQQRVGVLSHMSDILRPIILSRYGGAYQDNDVMWGNPVTEELRRYPTVLSYAWPKIGIWPHGINTGVTLSKTNAPFLLKLLESYWLEKDNSWGFNGVQMPYKVYEMNPESLYVYDKLQVMCTFNVCHPTWHPNHQRPWNEMRKPTENFSLDEVIAYHFAQPKKDPSFVSFETVKTRNDIAAKIGQRILKAVEKSGRMNLLA